MTDRLIDEGRFRSLIEKIKEKKLSPENREEMKKLIKIWKSIKKVYNNAIYETHEDWDPENDQEIRDAEAVIRERVLARAESFAGSLVDFNPPNRIKARSIIHKPVKRVCSCKKK